MSRNKKWSSNDKNQLLVENFRNFMEEGDFSPEIETNEERSWGQMGKDVMKGDFMGHGRMDDAKRFANGMVKRAYKLVRSGEHDDLETALKSVAGHMADRDSREEIYAAKKAAGDEFKTMDDLTFIQVLGADWYKKFGGTLSKEAEEAMAAGMDSEKRMAKKRKHNDELEQRRKKDQRSSPDDDDYEEEEEDPHARSFGITRDITPGNKDYEKERRATTGRWDEAKKRNK